jgi:hypothetical protein
MGRQRRKKKKKFLVHENGTQQDPHKPTWVFKPLHVIILLSSHKYVYIHTYTHTHTHMHAYIHTHTYIQCIKVNI